MLSPPDAPAAERMRAAHETVAAALSLTPDSPRETWGWDGRSLSRPMAGNLWLRLLELPAEKAGAASWNGPRSAAQLIPDSVPRPRLHAVHEWTTDTHAYHAELYDRVPRGALSATALPADDLFLPDSWWEELRGALAAVASVPTDRVAVRQERLDWAMPEFLGAVLDTRVPQWATTHADIQWSNLAAGPELVILDWERWGVAPAGYDEACLYISSLAAPKVAGRVWKAFAPVLSSKAGRFSQLVVASEFLQGIQRGNNLELEFPLKTLVAGLLAHIAK